MKSESLIDVEPLIDVYPVAQVLREEPRQCKPEEVT